MYCVLNIKMLEITKVNLSVNSKYELRKPSKALPSMRFVYRSYSRASACLILVNQATTTMFCCCFSLVSSPMNCGSLLSDPRQSIDEPVIVTSFPSPSCRSHSFCAKAEYTEFVTNMSITIDKILAASPSTERGRSTQLSSDPKGERIAYAVSVLHCPRSRCLLTYLVVRQIYISSLH